MTVKNTSRSAALSLAATVAIAGALVCGLASADAAGPAGVTADRAAVLKALDDCRKITEDTTRLACFDKATAAFDQAETQGQVVVIDREQAKAVRRQAFGFHLPTLHVFDGATKTEDGVDRLELQIDSAHQDGFGHWVFTSTDGAVWRQTDNEIMGAEPHKGSRLLIKTGVLGAYFCKVDGQPQVRCQRVS
jgi:hypothetical protein